jgi:hypothetical protein
MRHKNPSPHGGLAELIVQSNYQNYRRDAEPQQTTQPGNEPIPPRTVEHSLLCAKQFDRNSLCDCKR